MEDGWNLQVAIDYCKEQGAPQNQQALVELLRQVQAQSGGMIPGDALGAIAEAFSMKETFLRAVLKRFPSLRTEEAPHLLELCGGERCQMRNCRQLRRFVEETYRVKNGGISKEGGFIFRVTGCMKNCPNGPSLKWNGKLHSAATKELIQSIIEKKR